VDQAPELLNLSLQLVAFPLRSPEGASKLRQPLADIALDGGLEFLLRLEDAVRRARFPWRGSRHL
jgi:hypothetical protein